MSLPVLRSRRTHRLLATALSVLTLAAWLAAGSLGAARAAQEQPYSASDRLQVRDAWIRWLPSGLPAAGYMTLVNGSDRALELTAVTSDVYRTIELHHSATHDGMSHMEAVNQLRVPAHSALRLEAGGYHLMLLQPTHALAPGDHVSLILHFGAGITRSVSFEVRTPTGNAAGQATVSPEDMHNMPGMPAMHGSAQPVPAPTTDPR